MEFRYHMRSEFPDILSAHLHGAFHDPPLNNYHLPRAGFWPSSGGYRAFEQTHSRLDDEEASDWYTSKAQDSPGYDPWSQSPSGSFGRSQQRGGRLFEQSQWDHPSWAGKPHAAFPLYDPLPRDFDRREQKNPRSSSFPSPFPDSFPAHYHRGPPDPWVSFDKRRHYAPFEGNEGKGKAPGEDDQDSPSYTVEEPHGRYSHHPPTRSSHRRKTRRRNRARSEHGPKSSDWGPLNKDGRRRTPSPGYCWSLAPATSSSHSAPASPNPRASHLPTRRSPPEPDEESPSPVPTRQAHREPCTRDLPDGMDRDGDAHPIFRMQQELKREKARLDEYRATLARQAEELETRELQVQEREGRLGGQGWEHVFGRY
ncbi:MAG: hypothetical protein Q9196_002571 [Gyalolechia fulgens]